MSRKHICEDECGYLLWRSELKAAHWFAKTFAKEPDALIAAATNEDGEFEVAAFLRPLGRDERKIFRSLAKLVHEAAVNGWDMAVDSMDGDASGAFAMADAIYENLRLKERIERAVVDWRDQEIAMLRSDPVLAKHKPRARKP